MDTTTITAPPQTYQEWLDCFEYMKSSRISDEFISVLSKGSLQSSQRMREKFQIHIVNLINDMLDARTGRFISKLNGLLESNDIADIVVLFKNFSKDIKQCLFFNHMTCVAPQFCKELSDSVEKQTAEFLNKVVDHLSSQALETNHLEMEDALYQIRRIKFFGC